MNKIFVEHLKGDPGLLVDMIDWDAVARESGFDRMLIYITKDGLDVWGEGEPHPSS